MLIIASRSGKLSSSFRLVVHYGELELEGLGSNTISRVSGIFVDWFSRPYLAVLGATPGSA